MIKYLFAATAVFAACNCGQNEYCSPNLKSCKNKKLGGQYCNAVQACSAALRCSDRRCGAVSVYDFEVPDYDLPVADSSWNALTFGKGGARSRCPVDKLGDPMDQVGLDRSWCKSAEFDTGVWKYMWAHQDPVLVAPTGLTTLCPTEASPQGFFQAQFWKGTVDDFQDSGIPSVLDSLTNMDVTTYMQCEGPDEAKFPVVTGVVMEAYSQGFTIAAQDIREGKSGWCFTPITALADGTFECKQRVRVREGGQRQSYIIANVVPDLDLALADTMIRLVDVFDYSDVPDSMWAQAKMNDVQLAWVEEDKFHKLTSFSIPLYAEDDDVAHKALGDYVLDYQKRFVNTMLLTPPNVTFSPMAPGVDTRVEFMGRIKGRKLTVTSYFAFPKSVNFHNHYNPGGFVSASGI